MPDDPMDKGSKFDFDRDGPKLGPVRFLTKTALGFVLRPTIDIEADLAAAFGTGVDCSGLSDGLTQICRYMNEGDLAKAAISLRFLRLSPAGQHRDVVAKASPDDPVRPGWPAGTPGSVGGQFRPKDGAQAGEAAAPMVEVDRTEKAQRLARRRSVRSILKRVLSTKRFLRLLGENAAAALTEEIPGVDVAVTAATLADDIALLKEIAGDLNDATPPSNLPKKGQSTSRTSRSTRTTKVSTPSMPSKRSISKSSSALREMGLIIITSSSRARTPVFFQSLSYSRPIISSEFLGCCTRKSIVSTRSLSFSAMN